MPEAAFFYGTLMSPDVRIRVLCGLVADPETKRTKMDSLRLRPAILKGHKRHALKDRDYPGVVPTGKDSDQVLGMLCEGLTAQDVKRLDAFEGDEYERRVVQVYPGDGDEAVDCQVYIWTAGQEYLEDHDWELYRFVEDKQNIWLHDRCEFKEVDQLPTS